MILTAFVGDARTHCILAHVDAAVYKYSILVLYAYGSVLLGLSPRVCRLQGYERVEDSAGYFALLQKGLREAP